MSKVDHIQVSVRIKPQFDDQLGKYCLHTEPNLKDTIVLDVGGEQRYFSFDHVANENATQQDIFQHVGRPCVMQAMAGYNGCVFVYGQTGAGKTHTMIGTQDQPGLLPRSLDFLYEQVSLDLHQNNSAEYLVKCSFLEIYNEHIIDLLNPSTGNLTLREDLKKGVYVEYLTEESCSNLGQAIQVLQRGNQNRHIASTDMNIESSRSHSLFTIQIESKRQSAQTMIKNHRFARMHFVDLAGSERQKSSNASGERLREGCNINKSLHILGNVINSLAELSSQQQQKFVHYRDSKLTFLLKDSLGGNSRTHLIANVNQGAQQYQETLSTLQFAKRVKQVKNKAQINEDDSGNLESLKSEIKRLKQELAKKTIEHEFQFETPSKDFTQVLQSQNFLQSLEAESLIMNDIKYLKLEELLKCYLEQSTESETSLHLQLQKSQETLNEFRSLFTEGTERELQLRQAIQLMNAKLIRNDHEELNLNLVTSPIVFKVLQENFELKEIGGIQISQSLKLLQQNLTLLVSIGEIIKDSIQERRSLQTQLEDRIQVKYVSPNKYNDLQFQYELQEKDFAFQVEQFKSEIQEIQTARIQLQQCCDERDEQCEKLKFDNQELRGVILSEEQKYDAVNQINQQSKIDTENQSQSKLEDSERQNKRLEYDLNRKNKEFEKLIEKSQVHARDQAQLMNELASQISQLNRELKDKEVCLLRISRDYEEGKQSNLSLQRISFEMKQKFDNIVDLEVQDLKQQLCDATDKKNLLIQEFKEQSAFMENQFIADQTKFKQDLDNLESTLQFTQEQHIQTISEMTMKFSNEQTQYESLQIEFEKEKQNLQSHVERIQSDLQEKSSQSEEFQQTIQQQNQQIWQLHLQSEMSQETQEAAQIQVVELTKIKIQLEIDIIQEQTQTTNMNEQLNDLKRHIEEQTLTMEQQTLNMEQQTLTMEQQKTQLNQSNHINDELRLTHEQQLFQKGQAIQGLGLTVNKLQVEKLSTQQQVQQVEKKLNDSLSELKSELNNQQNYYISKIEEDKLSATSKYEKLNQLQMDKESQIVELKESLNKSSQLSSQQIMDQQNQIKLLNETLLDLEQLSSAIQEGQLMQFNEKQLELNKMLDNQKSLEQELLSLQNLQQESDVQRVSQIKNVEQINQNLKNVEEINQNLKDSIQDNKDKLFESLKLLQHNEQTIDNQQRCLEEQKSKNQEQEIIIQQSYTLNAELNTLIEELQSSIVNLQNQNSEIIAELQELQEVVKVMEQKDQENQEIIQQLSVKILQSEINLFETQDSLNQSNYSNDQQREQLKVLLSNLQNETHQYESTQEDLENQLQDLRSQISELDTLLITKEDQLQQSNQQLKEMLDLSEANEHHLQDTKVMLNNKISQQKQFHDDHNKKQFQDNEDEKKLIKRQYTQHLDKIDTQNFKLIQDYKEKDELVLKLNHIVKDLQSQINDLDNKLINLSHENELLTHDKENFNEEITQYQEEKQQQILNLEQDLFENEQTLLKVHDKAKDFCRQQEREINEIKEQYIKLEEEHNTIIEQNAQLQQENEQMVAEIENNLQESQHSKNEIKNLRQQDQKIKKESSEVNNRMNRYQQENSNLTREVESLQNEISNIMGHNSNPAQKVRYLNSVKQENSVLKQEKYTLTEQLIVLADEKNKLFQKVRTQNVSPIKREETDYDVQTLLNGKRVLQENMRMQSEISKLNSILNIPSNKKINANSQEVDRIIQSVQRVIQELVDCKSQLQAKEKDLESKNLKHQALERDLLLLRQKQYTNQRENSINQRENSASILQYQSSGEPVLRDNRQTGRKLNYQFQ